MNRPDDLTRGNWRVVTYPFLMLALLYLAACKTAEDQAEEYYRAGVAQLDAGNPDAAAAQFRQAILTSGQNRDAPLAYATLLRNQGKTAEAYSQYSQLAARLPDDPEAYLAMAGMALAAQNFAEARIAADKALALAPADIRAKGLQVELRYDQAVADKDAAGAQLALDAARAMVTAQPDNLPARRVLIASLLLGPDPGAALPEIDRAIAWAPGEIDLRMMRLNVFSRTGDVAASGTQMQQMYKQFPGNPDIRAWLLEWYRAQGDNEQTLAFLRDIAARNPGDADASRAVVQFVSDTQGPDATRAELLRLAQAVKDAALSLDFQLKAAEIAFGQGNSSEAIAELQQAVAGAPPSRQVSDIKVALARMLYQSGDTAGAGRLVHDVLVQDTVHAGALKLRATWLLAENRLSEAPSAVRAALDASPGDPDLYLMLADIYERQAAPDLAGLNYAMAVEKSDSGARESLLYFAFLTRMQRTDAAGAVLDLGLQANPQNVDLLAAAIDRDSGEQKWKAAEALVSRLQGVDSDQARAALGPAQERLARRQASSARLTGLLRTIVDRQQADSSARAAAILALVEAGKLPEARSLLGKGLAVAPDDGDLKALDSALRAMQDAFAPAPFAPPR